MVNENQKPVKVQKSTKIKLNLNFIGFVSTVISQKLMTKDIQTLRKLYISTVKVKSSNNITRVADRTKRDKLRPALETALKQLNLSFAEYDKVSSELVAKIRTKRASNYIEV